MSIYNVCVSFSIISVTLLFFMERNSSQKIDVVPANNYELAESFFYLFLCFLLIFCRYIKLFERLPTRGHIHIGCQPYSVRNINILKSFHLNETFVCTCAWMEKEVLPLLQSQQQQKLFGRLINGRIGNRGDFVPYWNQIEVIRYSLVVSYCNICRL